jgi:hypothetical protein
VATVSKPFSGILRRSSLGDGCYLVRNDEASVPPHADVEVYRAVVASGACAVRHSGMFQSTHEATALPGGYMYEMIGRHGFRALPERSWVFGPRAVRHILRLLDVPQPTRLLATEESAPEPAELADEWAAFAASDQLERIGASLGALASVTRRRLQDERLTSDTEPIKLPTPYSTDNPPSDETDSRSAGYASHMFDPRFSDAFFWRAETTYVYDSTGSWILSPDGTLKSR